MENNQQGRKQEEIPFNEIDFVINVAKHDGKNKFSTSMLPDKKASLRKLLNNFNRINKVIKKDGINVQAIFSSIDGKDHSGNDVEGNVWCKTFPNTQITSIYALMKLVACSGTKQYNKMTDEEIVNYISLLSVENTHILVPNTKEANFFENTHIINGMVAIEEVFSKYLQGIDGIEEGKKTPKLGIKISEDNGDKVIPYLDNIKPVEGFIKGKIAEYWKREIKKHETAEKPYIYDTENNCEFDSMTEYYMSIAKISRIEIKKVEGENHEHVRERLLQQPNDELIRVLGGIYATYEKEVSCDAEEELKGKGSPELISSLESNDVKKEANEINEPSEPSM
ncbi:MAG TPA: hypothetical protein DCP90_01435 [Clostridiales bacterium]|nr:MAG: hypothetical protein A2Y22_05365 [Clostridiales bacterium GWD2_32_59]HAN09258.1 hypothetical protein [Clostridiales bacterium]